MLGTGGVGCSLPHPSISHTIHTRLIVHSTCIVSFRHTILITFVVFGIKQRPQNTHPPRPSVKEKNDGRYVLTGYTIWRSGLGLSTGHAHRPENPEPVEMQHSQPQSRSLPSSHTHATRPLLDPSPLSLAHLHYHRRSSTSMRVMPMCRPHPAPSRF